MHRTASTSHWALAAICVCVSTPAHAQELRRDSVWNVVVVGAAAGAGVGVLVAKTTDDICSAPACASLFAVAGGALGYLIDSRTGVPAPVVPGQLIDDSKWNGALIGASAASAVVLFDIVRGCGPRGQAPCTAGGTLDSLWKGALFGAAVGALVDAAIPARAPGAAGSTRASPRHFSLAFAVRF